MKQKNEIDLENQIRGWCCHELRNPLNSIMNSTELIENYIEDEFKDNKIQLQKKTSDAKNAQKNQKIQM